MKNKNFYCFDINMTEACTLRCTYCIENFNKAKFKKLESEQIDEIIKKFDYLLESEVFLSKFNGISISFWGGEPTTNPKGIKKLMNYYRNNPKVDFFFYCNGFKLDHLYDYLKEYNEKYPDKFRIQISYDGLASHDKDRLDIKGKGSALKVKETFYKLQELGIPSHMHSTIAFKNFNCLSENYFEFKKINEYFNYKTAESYAPTIDYLSPQNYTDSEMNEFINTLKEEFKKIKDSELEYYRKNGRFFLSWLNPNKALCGAGRRMNSLELDGTLYPCHGVMNATDVRDTIITNHISNSEEGFTKNLIDSSNEFDEYFKYSDPDCENCHTHYCLKCNSKKYQDSEKETKAEKWVNYSNQPRLCQLYKLFGNIRMAFLKILENEKEINN